MTDLFSRGQGDSRKRDDLLRANRILDDYHDHESEFESLVRYAYEFARRAASAAHGSSVKPEPIECRDILIDTLQHSPLWKGIIRSRLGVPTYRYVTDVRDSFAEYLIERYWHTLTGAK